MNGKYLPVPTTYILPATSGDFEIYLLHKDRYVLYTKRGEQFTVAHRTKLMDQGIKQVYVPADSRKGYDEYLQNNLGTLLQDELIPSQERARVWSDTASRISKDLFEARLPDSVIQKRFGRFRQMVEQSTEFLRHPNALKELSQFITRDYDVYQHSIAVMVLSMCLFQTYDPSDELLNACGMGAMLHDIGKTRLDRELVVKDPDMMEPEELAALRNHPVLGVQVCSTIPLPPAAIHCVLFHHEREDGRGFPSGAGAGSQPIPIHAKVVAICNRYDYLTRDMPYRKGLPPFEALQTIMADQGFYETGMLKRLVQLLSDAKLT